MARSDKIKFCPRLHWVEGTNTRPDTVRKLPQEWSDWTGTQSASYNSYQGSTGFTALMSAWCSMVLWQAHDWMETVRGGGHGDYGGSERLRLDLNNVVWSRPEDPFPFPPFTSAKDNGNGTPTARHTYNGVCYHEARDSVYLCSGSAWGPVGGNVNDLWELSNVGVWTRRADPPANAFLECHLICRSTTGHLLFFSPNLPAVWDYNPGTNTWSGSLTTTGTWVNPQSAVCYDPDLDVVRFIEPNGTLRQFNCATNAWSAPVVTGVGPNIGSYIGPFGGLAHDPLNRRVVYWRSGTVMFTLDRANHWIPHPAQVRVIGGVPANNRTPPLSSPASSAPAVYGRFQWWRNKDCAIWVPATDVNVFAGTI
jgi:hypothetical protein